MKPVPDETREESVENQKSRENEVCNMWRCGLDLFPCHLVNFREGQSGCANRLQSLASNTLM